MNCDLEATDAPSSGVFRVSRGPDPFAWPDWSFAGDDRTFGNRWDDPEGSYRVLYASTDRLGAFVETLARFRSDPSVAAVLAGISGDDLVFPAGGVPHDWLEGRRIGQARVSGSYAAISRSRSLAWLRQSLGDRLARYDLSDLDAATIRLTAPRRFTQEVSRAVQSCSANGERMFAGITYLSRLGDELRNWAIFEPAEMELLRTDAIRHDDRDLREALQILRLEII